MEEAKKEHDVVVPHTNKECDRRENETGSKSTPDKTATMGSSDESVVTETASTGEMKRGFPFDIPLLV